MMLCSPNYRAVVFDVMGTLVREPFFDRVPAALGMTLEELLAAKHPTAWLEFERGEIDEDTFRKRFFSDGRAYDHEKMKAAMVDTYDWLPGVEGIVGELHGRGVNLHLLSNYPVWYQLIEEKLRLSKYAPWSFVSCNMGVRKPNAAIYQRAAAQLDSDPGELLFIDDRKSNCDAAAALGWDTIVFRDSAQLANEMADRGLVAAATDAPSP